ncbi:membrane protein insertion efficiency factor YidD [Raoultibacter massiliensis]|uniref:membrane protein insertion efficiency factor YidD n=1 Tax=Raoultibacter massiliensis TaxID=1852371 RepID=UPI003A93A879
MDKIVRFIKKIPCSVAVFLITFYQAAISPLFPSCCRFEPTCSQYGIIAFRRYGFFKGFKLTAKRILRCRPGGPHGYDPVP